MRFLVVLYFSIANTIKDIAPKTTPATSKQLTLKREYSDLFLQNEAGDEVRKDVHA